jgi:hypothetical protein
MLAGIQVRLILLVLESKTPQSPAWIVEVKRSTLQNHAELDGVWNFSRKTPIYIFRLVTSQTISDSPIQHKDASI